MNIYFASAIRGGITRRDWLIEITSALREIGHEVFAPFEMITPFGSAMQLSDRQIYQRDISRINDCDFVIAEVSTPSLGVGYEIAYSESIEKPIICLAYKSSSIKVSAMVAGSNLPFHRYIGVKSFVKIIADEVVARWLPPRAQSGGTITNGEQERQEVMRQLKQVKARTKSLIKTKNEYVLAGMDTRAHQLEIEQCVERDIELSAILRKMGDGSPGSAEE